MALGQLRAPITLGKSNSYAESSGRILTDPTGERRNRQFCQHFRGLRSCQPNPSGESGINPSYDGLSEWSARSANIYSQTFILIFENPRSLLTQINPDSPDEMAFSQLRAPISIVRPI